MSFAIRIPFSRKNSLGQRYEFIVVLERHRVQWNFNKPFPGFE